MGGAKEIRIVVLIVKRRYCFFFWSLVQERKKFLLADHGILVILYIC